MEYGEGLAQRVRVLAPVGIDVALDLVGGDALERSREALAAEAREASVTDPGVLERPGGHYVFVRPDAAMLDRLVGYVADGRLRVEVTETFPLDEAAQALSRSKEGHTQGKIVITVA